VPPFRASIETIVIQLWQTVLDSFHLVQDSQRYGHFVYRGIGYDHAYLPMWTRRCLPWETARAAYKYMARGPFYENVTRKLTDVTAGAEALSQVWY
jgi:hypothetical protein